MLRLTVLLIACGAVALANVQAPQNSDQLVNSVLNNCGSMECVKEYVLGYLDNILHIQSDSRNLKNIDTAIFKRAARVLKTHEFRMQLPEMVFGGSQVVYNPRSGLDFAETNADSGRGLLKKKLLFPALLLLKLKMKALMPILVALVGLKAMKALILSKLAIAIVLGFVIYQLCAKSGMAMPMMMAPAVEPPTPMYGVPAAPTTSPPSSYEPGWEPSAPSGPYSRIWTSGSGAQQDSQSMAYSAYYPGASSTTLRP